MQKITIQCERVQAKTLQPGDLFSTHGSDYWEMFPFLACVGHAVFVRTYAESPAGDDDLETIVYKITILREEGPTHADQS